LWGGRACALAERGRDERVEVLPAVCCVEDRVPDVLLAGVHREVAVADVEQGERCRELEGIGEQHEPTTTGEDLGQPEQFDDAAGVNSQHQHVISARLLDRRRFWHPVDEADSGRGTQDGGNSVADHRSFVDHSDGYSGRGAVCTRTVGALPVLVSMCGWHGSLP
jgi:hypothetical protein